MRDYINILFEWKQIRSARLALRWRWDVNCARDESKCELQLYMCSAIKWEYMCLRFQRFSIIAAAIRYYARWANVSNISYCQFYSWSPRFTVSGMTFPSSSRCAVSAIWICSMPTHVRIRLSFSALDASKHYGAAIPLKRRFEFNLIAHRVQLFGILDHRTRSECCSSSSPGLAASRNAFSSANFSFNRMQMIRKRPKALMVMKHGI